MNRLRARRRWTSPSVTRSHSPEVDDPGDDVEGPGPVDVALLRVDGEGDAHRGDGELGRLLALDELVTELVEIAHDAAAARSGRVGSEHLVPPGRVVAPPGRAGRIGDDGFLGFGCWFDDRFPGVGTLGCGDLGWLADANMMASRRVGCVSNEETREEMAHALASLPDLPCPCVLRERPMPRLRDQARVRTRLVRDGGGRPTRSVRPRRVGSHAPTRRSPAATGWCRPRARRRCAAAAR